MLPERLLPEDPVTLALLVFGLLFLLATAIFLFARFTRTRRRERISFDEWVNLGGGYVRGGGMEENKGDIAVRGYSSGEGGVGGGVGRLSEDKRENAGVSRVPEGDWRGKNKPEYSGGDDVLPEDETEELPTPKKESEITLEELARREKKLFERESKIKDGMRRELEEKGVKIERKRLGGLVENELDKIEDERNKQLEMLDGFKNERKRILRLMEAAEKRYGNGELKEKNFRIIMSDYQKQLIEIDVGIARCNESLEK